MPFPLPFSTQEYFHKDVLKKNQSQSQDSLKFLYKYIYLFSSVGTE